MTKSDIRRYNDWIDDPYAERSQNGLAEDTLAFAREFRLGPLTEKELGRPPTFVDFIYWFAMIFIVHHPIIAKYGHYPYRDTSSGRISTRHELYWLEQTSHFGAMTNEEDGKKIRADVVAGRWSPLVKQGKQI